MPNLVYWTSVFFVRAFFWDGRFITKEKLPRDEASIYIANHSAASGPIGCYCSFPFELHSWLQAEMADRELAEPYLRADFVERSLGVRPPASYTVAHWLIKIAFPYLQAIHSIPVYRDYERFQTTLQITVDRLKAGHQVMIFPEDSEKPYDPVSNMAPFQKGMVRVAELYYQQTGKRVAFYPVGVHPSKEIRVGLPIRYSPLGQPSAERLRIKNYLEREVRALYLESEGILPVETPLAEG
jgi:1-acyl-sn-glycerol-3-phosphate acyltransferase